MPRPARPFLLPAPPPLPLQPVSDSSSYAAAPAACTSVLAAITLFEVFLHLLNDQRSHPDEPFPSVWSAIPTIIEDILK